MDGSNRILTLREKLEKEYNEHLIKSNLYIAIFSALLYQELYKDSGNINTESSEKKYKLVKAAGAVMAQFNEKIFNHLLVINFPLSLFLIINYLYEEMQNSPDLQEVEKEEIKEFYDIIKRVEHSLDNLFSSFTELRDGLNEFMRKFD